MDKESTGIIVDEYSDVDGNGHGNASDDNGGVSNATGGETINGFATVNPGTGGGNSSSGTARRRGRPAGSRNRNAGTAKATPKGNISSLENILLSIHFFGAHLMATPELEMNEDEAKRFAGSLARVSSLYDDRINPKLVAWIDLACVAGAIYGPRAIAISARMKAESSAAQRPPVIIPVAAQVQPINQRNAAPKTPAGNTARSPVEMFGPEFFGSAIPDAV